MARLRRKYPPKRTLPEAAYRQSPSSMLSPYAPQDNTVQSATPSPSLLQPLLSNTSSSSSVSTGSARIQSASVGPGIPSASSIEFHFNRPHAGDERLNTSRLPEVVGSALVTSNGTSDGQLNAAALRTSRMLFPASGHRLSSPTADNKPSNCELSIVAGHNSMSANNGAQNGATTSSPSSLEKSLSIMSRKFNRHSASNILGHSSSAVMAALTNRHRHDL
ncbi:hypothetical protein V1525DRAFT_405855 [Lipomyces kononenkoae]|uniref:Uncharacterized protein n=1 Tax=Lipomyces kononenkoae TaxID=34357 RepID=A0ACC3SYL7_LIPKO